MPIESVIVSGLSSFLQFLISTASQEIAPPWGLKGKLEKLQTTLTTIEAVVQDAENQQVEKEGVKNWLRRLKSAAYDVDDVMDEFHYEALRSKMETQNIMKMRKVCNFFSLSSNPLAFRFKMASKLKDINDVLEGIRKDALIIGLNLVRVDSFDSTSMNRAGDRQTSSLLKDEEVVGREIDKSKLVDMLLNTSNDQIISVIPIVGMGGLGKTTLAQWVFNDPLIVKYFDLRIWVCVSQEFEVKRLLIEIIESIGDKCDASLNLDRTARNLQKKLMGKRFLLVLDDVWSEDPKKWDALKEPFKYGSVGSKVIVTTRSNKLARIMATGYTHQLDILSIEECWNLFRRIAFSNGGPQETLNLVEIGRRIANKCGGVPLAVKVLGSLMHSKIEEREWSSMEQGEIWNLMEDNNQGILPILKLSYDHLPPELKHCFAYCSVFPKDYAFHKETLIKVWMAEGFLQQAKGRKQMEDVGNEYFNILLWNSFFQHVENDEYGDIATCKMHTFIHDLAQFVGKLEYSTMGAKNVEDISEVRGLYLEEMSEIPEALRKAKKLRTIFLSSKSLVLNDDMLMNFQTLRVLDVSSCNIEELPPSIRRLKHLRYLDLSYTLIKVLPQSITSLYNLQTLKLNGCLLLKELPKEMKKMVSLRHIELPYSFDSHMPVEMGRLSNLQTLTRFIVGKDEGRNIKQLKGLNLRGELTICNLENVTSKIEATEAKLIGKQHIRDLTLRWSDSSRNGCESESGSRKMDDDVLEGLEPPHPSLKRFVIEYFGGEKFPTWMANGLSAYKNLMYFQLKGCPKLEYVPTLGELPFLKVSKLVGMEKVNCVGREFYYSSNSTTGGATSSSSGTTTIEAFQSLKELRLSNMPYLVKWLEALPSFPSLERLTIYSCPKLKIMPSRFPSLKALHFEETNEMALSLLSSNLTSLNCLHIYACQDLKSVPERLLQNNAHVLEELSIFHCPELETIFPSEGQEVMHLIFPSLKILVIHKCPLVKPLRDLQGMISLRVLVLVGFTELMSLPEGLQQLTRLEDLHLSRFSEGLDYIQGEESLQHLVSLRRLRLVGWPHHKNLRDQLKHLTNLGHVSAQEEFFTFISDIMRERWF